MLLWLVKNMWLLEVSQDKFISKGIHVVCGTLGPVSFGAQKKSEMLLN